VTTDYASVFLLNFKKCHIYIYIYTLQVPQGEHLSHLLITAGGKYVSLHVTAKLSFTMRAGYVTVSVSIIYHCPDMDYRIFNVCNLLSMYVHTKGDKLCGG